MWHTKFYMQPWAEKLWFVHLFVYLCPSPYFPSGDEVSRSVRSSGGQDLFAGLPDYFISNSQLFF